MFLKCFFHTNGLLRMVKIYSPASCTNIEGTGTGIAKYFSGMATRYGQAKRHWFASLDVGYVVKKSFSVS